MSPLSLPVPIAFRLLAVAAVALAANSPTRAEQRPDDLFYKAYYLDRGRGDLAGAADLYARAIDSRGLSSELRGDARQRLDVCHEELATDDLTRLMPPEPLAYIEINRPGDRLRKLIDQLGLLADPGDPAPKHNRLAISPAVIDALLGLRGLSIAVTGFNPATEQPSGVAVLHPGDVDLIRGLIETALPVQSDILDPICGYPSYRIENVYVALTKRLVIVGSSEAEITGVIERLRGDDEESLATNPDLAEVLAARDGALLSFCVNPKPLMPLVNMLTAGASQSREIALAKALFDIQSFESLAGRCDVSDEGLLLELTLRLDGEHRNLVYNFLRRPALDPETLRCVPAGAAAFVALAMNDPATTYHNPVLSQDADRPVVTALDIGRELFANINGIAVYALPPAKGTSTPRGMLPDVAAVITVNDPAQTQALWYQILGIAAVAAGAPTMEGMPQEIEGVAVRSYSFNDDVTVFVGMLDSDLLVGATESAIRRAIKAREGGECILKDPAFAGPMKQIASDTTLALVAHPRRCLEIARQYMSPGDMEEVEPITALMEDTTVCLAMRHSDRVLQLSAALSGLPDVSALVSDLLAKEREQGQARKHLAHAMQTRNWDAAVDAIDQQLALQPEDTQLLRSKFDVLVRAGDDAEARSLGQVLAEAMDRDANGLNTLAWALLTEKRYDGQYDGLALRMARRSNDLSKHRNWAYLDTLALAEFRAGNVEEAIRLEQQAIDLCKHADGGGLAELEAALERFRGGADEES